MIVSLEVKKEEMSDASSQHIRPSKVWYRRKKEANTEKKD